MRSQRKAATGWQARAAAENNARCNPTEAGGQRQRPGGKRAVSAYLGTALRHLRRAVELNLQDGPSAAVAASAQQARDAIDGALSVCVRGRSL
jgi:hypothetical protein